MKLCSVVLVAVSLAFVCVNGQKGGGFQDLLKKCGEKSNMDMDAMKKSLATGNADGKMNCPAECICKAMGIMNADGGPNEAGAEKLFATIPAKPKEIAKACMSSMKAGSANCESGGKMIQCVMSKMAQMKGKQ